MALYWRIIKDIHYDYDYYNYNYTIYITFTFIFVCSLLDRLFLLDHLSSACEADLGDSFFLSLVAHCRRFRVNFDFPF